MHFTPPSSAVYWEPQVPAKCSLTDPRPAKTAAARLRRQVCLWVGDSPEITDHLHWLAHNGFGREDSRQIRYTVEVFANCEPIFAVTHALGGRADICDHPLSASFGMSGEFIPEPVKSGLITLGGISAEQVANAHPFFRALHAWPRYSDLVSREMARWHAFPELVVTTITEARTLASSIRVCGADNPGQSARPSSDQLIASCEVLVVACALRRMFINAETAARANAAGWDLGTGSGLATV